MPDVSVRRAGPADHPTVERLWLMFRHDMSEYSGVLPHPDGSFRRERLDSAFTDADWAAYLVTSGEHPVGLAFVRGLTAHTRVLNSFFVVRAARRAGIGLRAVRDVMAAHPGRWEIAFQEENTGAVRFWRRVAADIAGEAWDEERRPVPGRPDVPPDVWISLDVRATSRPSLGGPGVEGPGVEGPESVT
ncbi:MULTISPECIES: GNAT family N-acetyltransferase [unclassified Streptomyces]|uniref:GNAT family N-acetyltransferase n=1 Tax=Streptomyces sp. NPDC127129 TaxID=3345373 RepID=UPI00363BF839